MADVDQTPTKMVTVDWQGVPDLPVFMANVFAVQVTPDGVVLTIGQATAPIFGGEEEEQKVAVKAMDSIPARPLVRVNMTQERLQELFGAIGQSMINLVQSGLASPEIVASFEIPQGAAQ